MVVGKFEACQDNKLGEYLHSLTLDGCLDRELGDVETFGWYGLLLSVNGMKSYIVNEDNYGFFTYTEYDLQDKALSAWSQLEAEYQEFEDNIEED